MRTSESVTFVNSEGAGASPLRVLRLFQVEDPDNLNAVQRFEKEYLATNGERPTYVTREENQAHAERLNTALTESFSQKIRVYGTGKTSNVAYYVVQGTHTVGQEMTATVTENITINGSTQLSTQYPIDSVSNINLDLRRNNGGAYTGTHTLDEAGIIQLGEVCYGFVTVTYVHRWVEVTVTGQSRTAKDKQDALLLVTSDNGNDSITVNFPDVEDPESGVTPDDETFIRIWAHRNKNNRAARDPLVVRQFYETSRTVGTVEVDGVTIERARTVTMREGEALNGQQYQFVFDIPATETGG